MHFRGECVLFFNVSGNEPMQDYFVHLSTTCAPCSGQHGGGLGILVVWGRYHLLALRKIILFGRKFTRGRVDSGFILTETIVRGAGGDIILKLHVAAGGVCIELRPTTISNFSKNSTKIYIFA